METINIILVGIAFVIAIILIAWGFNAVDKYDMPQSEKTLWKVFFVLIPIVAFILFVTLRKPVTK